MDRQTDRQIHRCTKRQIHRGTNRQTDRQRVSNQTILNTPFVVASNGVFSYSNYSICLPHMHPEHKSNIFIKVHVARDSKCRYLMVQFAKSSILNTIVHTYVGILLHRPREHKPCFIADLRDACIVVYLLYVIKKDLLITSDAHNMMYV